MNTNTVAPKRTGRPVSPNAARQIAVTIYAVLSAEGKTGKEIREAFVSTLKNPAGAPITQGTAQVFYHKIRKELGLTTLRPRKSVASEV